MPFENSPSGLRQVDAEFAVLMRVAVTRLRMVVTDETPQASVETVATACDNLRHTYMGNRPITAAVIGKLAELTPHDQYRHELVGKWKETVANIPNMNERTKVIALAVHSPTLRDAAYLCLHGDSKFERRVFSSKHAARRLIT